MNIVAPLSNIDHYESLVEAGVDEFYGGFIPYEWLKKYNTSGLNRREMLFSQCNICTVSSMRILSKMVEKHGVQVKITFNALGYNPEQLPIIEHIMRELIQIGFNTFIIADISLIIYIRSKKLDCKIHLSGECSPNNRLVIQFLNDYDIERYVFSRKTTPEDMKSCIEHNGQKDIQFEAFILNSLCTFTGAFCNTIHCDQLEYACELPYHIHEIEEGNSRFKHVTRTLKIVRKIQKKQMENLEDNINDKGENRLGEIGCGLCRIKLLEKIGVTHLKVVGRGKTLTNLKSDIENLKEIIHIAKQETSIDNFTNLIREKYFDNQCPIACFYPD